MSRKKILIGSLVISILILISLAIGLSVYFAGLPDRSIRHQAFILGQTNLVSGSPAALRVLVRDSKGGEPLPESAVRVALKSGEEIQTLYEGQTDDQGSAEVSFKLPELEGSANLIVETRSQVGEWTSEPVVVLQRDYRILLSSDKPVYQPGQVIHLRALALNSFDLSPAAGQPLEFVIEDGRGNKVFRKQATTSEFGAGWTDFQLAEQLNAGDYKITASLGEVSSEKTVRVEYYVLPKFDVSLQTDNSYYLPGQAANAALTAEYFFGQPVANSRVQIEGFSFDVERVPAFSLEGTTDAGGQFNFSFEIPEFLVGVETDSGLGRFYLEGRVTDTANQSEADSLSLPVANQALVIEAIFESGQPRPGLENILYIMTTYPDGTPAATTLSCSGQTVETGAGGIAGLHFVPSGSSMVLSVHARDERGNQAVRTFSFNGETSEGAILLRPDRPVYRVGETMNLEIFAARPQGNAYLDIVRDGQTVSTRAVPVIDGKANIAVDLTPDLSGTLELHAYQVLIDGTIVMDTRLAAVDNANSLAIHLSTDREEYRPGETAELAIEVRGENNQGLPSALSLAIVDESVFALQEEDPGFARLYFLLQKELLEPRYEIHGYSVPEMMDALPAEQPELFEAYQAAAFASLAAALPVSRLVPDDIASAAQRTSLMEAFSLKVDTVDEAHDQALDRQQGYFSGLASALGIFSIISGAASLFLAGTALKRKKLLKPGLGIFTVIVLLLVGSLLLAIFSEAYQILLVVVPCILGFSAIGFLVVLVDAFRLKDAWMGLTLGIGALIIVILFVAIEIFIRFRVSSETPAILILIGIGLSILSIWLLTVGIITRTRRINPPAAGATLLLLLFLVGCSAAQMNLPFIPQGGAVPETSTGQAPLDVEAPVQPEAAPRLRQYFPETLLWLPDGVTDEQGKLNLIIPLADSITTWRMTALASSRDGRLGSTSAGLRVFQEFFIDLDLPLALTVGDQIWLPVSVYNYTSDPQSVRLELAPQDWFTLDGEASQEIQLEPNQVLPVYYPITVDKFGLQSIQVTAFGANVADAIQKQVRVYPNGKLIRSSIPDQLIPGEPIRQAIAIPADAIAGTAQVLVKIYPGVVSQVVEGLDALLRMPYGCFEQTSSITYPNVLVLNYLQKSGQTAPELQLKAEEYIGLGYQRLLSFEVSGGGFSLFGDSPADPLLTAYGLQELSDMSKVWPVDENLIERTAGWLLAKRESDGSWALKDTLLHEGAWQKLANQRLPATAFITWSLIEAGYLEDVSTSLAYLRAGLNQADDPYTLSMIANALVAADLKSEQSLSAESRAVIDRLVDLANSESGVTWWISSVPTYLGSSGQTASLETTALAALAMARSGYQSVIANQALAYLVQNKDNYGTWGTTQATVLSLKALLASLGSSEGVGATVTVTLNGEQAQAVEITADNFDVLQLLAYNELDPGREYFIELSAQGVGRLSYQLGVEYYLPWSMVAGYPGLEGVGERMDIRLEYDRSELAVNDMLGVRVAVALLEPGSRAESALIDLGIPPGFTVQTDDLQAMVEGGVIERYELTGRQIMVYVVDLSAEQPFEFSYRLRAKYPLSVATPASRSYDYYNPEVFGESQPVNLVVTP